MSNQVLNPKKAGFILRTDETIGMLRASESHSLFVKVIHVTTTAAVKAETVSQTRIVQMIAELKRAKRAAKPHT